MSTTAISSPVSRQNIPLLSGKKDKKAPPAPPPDPNVVLEHNDAVVVSNGVGVVGFKDGKPVDANGNPVKDTASLKTKVWNWMVPDKSVVTDDYGAFQRWQFVAHAADDALGYIGLTATAAGLAAGLHIPYLAFLGAGTAALMAKSGINFIGDIIGNNKGKAIDDDPAKWTAKSNIITSGALAVQSLCLAVPGAYFALVPTTNAIQEYGNQTDGISQQLISNHQAKTGAVGYVSGKNKNQNLISGLIGTGLGVGCSIGLGLIIGPWAPLLAVPAFLGVAVLASLAKGHALKLDNLTNSVVRGLAHQDVTKDHIPTPDELKADKQNRKDLTHQRRILVGADPKPFAQNTERLGQLADIFGDNKFLLDLGETQGLMHVGKKQTINCALSTDATQDDEVKAEYTAQVLSDIVDSPGYQKLAQQDPKGAELQAMRVAVGYTADFADRMKELPKSGWSVDRTVLGTGTDRIKWHASTTPIAPVNHDQLQAFMQTGQLATEQPAPAVAEQPVASS